MLVEVTNACEKSGCEKVWGRSEKEDNMWGLEELHACMYVFHLALYLCPASPTHPLCIENGGHKMHRLLAWGDTVWSFFLRRLPTLFGGRDSRCSYDALLAKQIIDIRIYCSSTWWIGKFLCTMHWIRIRWEDFYKAWYISRFLL
jgi:hypothetical protein